MEELPTQNSGDEFTPETAKRKLKPAEAAASAEQTGMPPPPAPPIPTAAAPMPEPAMPATLPTYEELIAAVKRCHLGLRRSLGDALKFAKEAGDALIELKELAKARGEKWLTVLAKLNIDKRTAQDYMDIARNWGDYLLKALAQNPCISITQALLILRRERRKVEYQRPAEKDPWAVPRRDVRAMAKQRIDQWDEEIVAVVRSDFGYLWEYMEQEILRLIEKRGAPRICDDDEECDDSPAEQTEAASPQLQLHAPDAEPDEWNDWETQPAATQPEAAQLQAAMVGS